MTTTTTVMIPVSVGELIDKITILELKRDRITDSAKLLNIQRELRELTAILDSLTLSNQQQINSLRSNLAVINSDLWGIENHKRACETAGQFDSAFLESARQVYLKNDVRAEIKREINQLTGSSIVEEKSY
jgi:hypothetical protein